MVEAEAGAAAAAGGDPEVEEEEEELLWRGTKQKIKNKLNCCFFSTYFLIMRNFSAFLLIFLVN